VEEEWFDPKTALAAVETRKLSVLAMNLILVICSPSPYPSLHRTGCRGFSTNKAGDVRVT
jgi:hypothetical protein